MPPVSGLPAVDVGPSGPPSSSPSSPEDAELGIFSEGKGVFRTRRSHPLLCEGRTLAPIEQQLLRKAFLFGK